jgi:hypothetical protein
MGTVAAAALELVVELAACAMSETAKNGVSNNKY